MNENNPCSNKQCPKNCYDEREISNCSKYFLFMLIDCNWYKPKYVTIYKGASVGVTRVIINSIKEKTKNILNRK